MGGTLVGSGVPDECQEQDGLHQPPFLHFENARVATFHNLGGARTCSSPDGQRFSWTGKCWCDQSVPWLHPPSVKNTHHVGLPV